MVSSSDTKRGRTEAYERMRASEDRLRALRGQTVIMKKSLKSSKKVVAKEPILEANHYRNHLHTPARDQTPSANTYVEHDGYHAPMAVQYSMLDSKQYTSTVMRQLLGVGDNSGLPPSGFSDMSQFSIYPNRAPSPSSFFDKSMVRGHSHSVPQSPSKTPLQISVSNGHQRLGSSQSFASLFSQDQHPQNYSISQNYSVPTSNASNVLSYPQTTSKLSYNNSGVAGDAAAAHLIYNANFSGLESHGASGMTILEELIDVSLKVCENGRLAGQKHNARGAALLTSNGKVYTGCDIYLTDKDPNAISAERCAVMAAVADGSSAFNCLVLSSDTMVNFPVPDGLSREFLRSFGVFPVILVNCELNMKHSSTQELYPINENMIQNNNNNYVRDSGMNTPGGFQMSSSSSMTNLKMSHSDSRNFLHTQTPGGVSNSMMGTFRNGGQNVNYAIRNNEHSDFDDFENNRELDPDIHLWKCDQVLRWLVNGGLEELTGTFSARQVDGRVLLEIDDNFAKEVLMINHALKRRKLLLSIEKLKKFKKKNYQDKTLDDLDEYVLLLEGHRIKLVAKLKAVFDRFDQEKTGCLTGEDVEKALVYMSRPIDTQQVEEWLSKLKNKNVLLEFPEFVSQYTALYAGLDPDVPVSQGNARPSSVRTRPSSSSRERRRGRSRSRSRSSERWNDSEEDSSESVSGGHKEKKREKERKDRGQDRDKDKERKKSSGSKTGTSREKKAASGSSDGDILEIRVLAELKSIFDRFAVDSCITPPETVQALTEAGIVAPRREITQYLRAQKHLGLARNIAFFDFIRAFASIRGPGKRQVQDPYQGSGLIVEGDDNDHSRSRRGVDGVEGRSRSSRDVEDPRSRSASRRARENTSDTQYVRGYHRDEAGSRERDSRRDRDEDRDRRKDRDRDWDGDGDRGRDRDRSRDRGGREYSRSRKYEDEDGRTRGDRDSSRDKRDLRDSYAKGRFGDERGDGRDRDRDRDSTIDRGRDRDRDGATDRGRGDYGRSSTGDRGGVSLREGMTVEAQYKGKGKWYRGTVKSVRNDGYVDVEYDDGERDIGLSPQCVQPVREKRVEEQRNRSMFTIDEKVEGNYRGKGKWFPGKITRDRGDHTFDIAYDDGESETRVDELLIRVMGGGGSGSGGGGGIARSPSRASGRIEEGSKVEGNYRGKGKWYAGTVTRDRGDRTFDISYDDGESETRVEETLIRLIVFSDDTSSYGRDSKRSFTAPKKFVSYRPGDLVFMRTTSQRSWVQGEIRDVFSDCCDILLDRGGLERDVPFEDIKLLEESPSHSLKLFRGDYIEVKVRRGSGSMVREAWRAGKILTVNSDKTFDVQFDDGEKQNSVLPSLVRAAVEVTLAEGDAVEARYRGRSKFFPGKIAKDRGDGTYDISYNDGEFEKRVSKEYINLMKKSSNDNNQSTSNRNRANHDDFATTQKLTVDMKVEAKYKGKDKLYKGRITRVRLNGTYDIDYDDGEKEIGVARSLIFPLGSGGGGDRQSSREPGRIEEGAKVEGNYRGKGKWFPGKITRDRGDHTFDIAYDDGESETRVDELLIRVMGGGGSGSGSGGGGGIARSPSRASGRIEEGSKVEGNYRGKGKWYAGTVTRDRGDRTFDISYDDGESETRVEETLIRLIGGASSSSSRLRDEDAPVEKLTVDMKVEAKYKGKDKLYKGRITRVRLNGTYDIDYDDGEKEIGVARSLIFPLGSGGGGDRQSSREPGRIEEGAKVEGNYRGKGKWFPGKITRDRGDHTFDIAYDDGESETRVDELLIRVMGGGGSGSGSGGGGGIARSPSRASGRIEEGSKVEGNYRGKGKWYAGTVTRDRGDRTFDISYDDGESETRVEETLIRLIGGASSSSSRLRDEDAPVEKLTVDMKVEAKYKGKDKLYKGRITRVRLNGTYDIDYDDGEKEIGVARSLIFPLGSGGGGDRQSSREPGRIEEGAKVEGNYRGKGKWFPGKITRDRGDHTFDIAYDDGESETRVDELLIRVMGGGGSGSGSGGGGGIARSPSRASGRIEEGSKVEGNYRGKGKWYAGTVTRDRGDRTFDISYDDGESETRVEETLIRLIGGASSSSSRLRDEDAPVEKLTVDMKVEAKYKGKDKLYKGRITRVRLNGTYDIDYDDGEKEIGVARSLIFPLGSGGGGDRQSSREPGRIEEGAKVEGNYRGKGKWFPGKITRDRGDHTFDIAYDDGESETRVDELLIRVMGGGGSGSGGGGGIARSPSRASGRIEEGSKVEGNYRGKGKWYAGTVTRDRGDRTFDISYDDGESETRVEETLIRLIGGASSSSSRLRDEDAPVEKLTVDMKVEAKYKGKDKLYKGRITRVRLNGTYDIDYDDGEKEIGVARSLIFPLGSGGGGDRQSSREPGRIEEGAKVEGNYRGKGKWFPGKITRDRGDHTFDIAYDDGESETRVDELLIRVMGGGGSGSGSGGGGGIARSPSRASGRIEEGSKVEGNYRGKGKWYAGTVTRDRGDRTFDISYDDGESETRVEETLIRLIGGASSSSSRLRDEDAPVEKLTVDMKVEAKYKGKDKLYKGRITRVRLNGTYDIDYDDGEKEIGVARSLIFPLGSGGGGDRQSSREPGRIEEGAKVEGNYRGKGKWFPGKITRDRGDHTFDIAYDDGESETRVDELLIRVMGGGGSGSGSGGGGGIARSPSRASGRIEEGSKVEGNYRGKGKWYAGTVTRDRGDRTFDISYDDGESETRVEETLIRLIGGASSSSSRLRDEDAPVEKLTVDMKVEAKYKGKDKLYKGRITRVRLNGTYDIDYDDGEKEIGVARSLIFPLGSGGGGDRQSSREPGRIEEGAKVEGNYRGKGKWFPGKITRDRGDHTFDIAYDDGESETRVDELLIRVMGGGGGGSGSGGGSGIARSPSRASGRIEEGSKVEGNYRGKGKWYAGTVTRDRGDRTFDISYDDGESETRVEETLIRLIGGASSSSSRLRDEDAPVEKLTVDMKVEAKYKGKDKLYKGRITRVRLNGTYDIDYDDGEKEIGVARSLIFPLGSGGGGDRQSSREPGRIEEGAKVEGNYRGKGKWFPGKITRDRGDHTFDIAYDDGESETRVDELLIRVMGGGGSGSGSGGGGGIARSPSRASGRIEEGSKVEGNYRGKGKWYAGTVTRDRGDRTFDISYDDGESETRVEETLIRLIGGASSSSSRLRDEDAPVEKLTVDMKVEAKYKGKDKLFKGRITRVRLNGTYDIDYDDGEKEIGVARSLIFPLGSGGGGDRQSSREPGRIEEGAKVEGNYRGKGKWFPGKITRDRGDHTFDIAYDDGESETRVDELLIRVMGGGGGGSGSGGGSGIARSPSRASGRIEEGSKVEGNYRGKGKWYAGTVTRDRGDRTFDISYDDGESETRVEETLIRLIGGASSSSSRLRDEDAPVEKLTVDMKVEAKYKGKDKLYKGRITRVRLNGTYDIDYDDGEKEIGVARSLIFPLGSGGGGDRQSSREPGRIEEGAKVEGNYRGKGKWFPGKITRDRGDHTFDIAYDDGESETRVDELLIRVMGGGGSGSGGGGGIARSPSRASGRIEEGSKVEGNYRGKGKWYAGTVTRDRGDRTFDISYDDGESETRVEETLIRLIGGASSSSSRLRDEDAPVEKLTVDMKVEAKYKGKDKLYKGRITRVRLNGTYDIDYDDGEKEIGVARSLIFPLGSGGGGDRQSSREPGRIEEGAKVEGNYRGKGKWFPGKITRDRGDHTFDIAYDDGESETRVDELLIRVMGGGGSGSGSGGGGGIARSPSRASGRIEEGSKVEGNYRGKGKWYAGTVTRDRGDRTFDISYDDGESETRVEETLIRLIGGASSSSSRLRDEDAPVEKLTVDMKVEAKYKGKDKLYKGRITRVRLNGTYDIDYDDGEKEIGVARSLIFPLGSDGGGDRQSSREPGRIEEGAKVEGNYRGKGKWFPGKITRDRGDHTFDIAYDDGESETRVDELLIRVMGGGGSGSGSGSGGGGGIARSPSRASGRIEEGSKVEGNYRGKGKWYAGTVTRDRGDRTFDISYDDGESETRVEETLIRLIGGASSSSSRLRDEDAPVEKLTVDMKVEAKYKGKDKLYKGRITRVRLNGTYDIDYDDGEKEIGVARSLIFPLGSGGGGDRQSSREPGRIEEGAKVEGNYRGKGKWFPGKITRDRGDHTFDIAYDDGESETRVDELLIRVMGGGGSGSGGGGGIARSPSRASGRIEEGSKVEGNYRGKGKWYAGTVTRDRGDRTFDISYDDGESETRVEETLIRLTGGSSSSLQSFTSLKALVDFVEGSEVEANYKGRNWYPGVISRVRLNGTFDIAYDDGETELGVKRENVRFKESVGSHRSQPPTPSRSSTGNTGRVNNTSTSYAISDID